MGTIGRTWELSENTKKKMSDAKLGKPSNRKGTGEKKNDRSK